jgi:TM2 domain-containing membrane protein YozV
MNRVNSGTAYLLWLLGIFGVCGVQRLYSGQIVSGLFYLFTLGFCYVGQFIDLFLIPSMVEHRNIYLKGLYASQHPQIGPTPNVTVQIGDVPRSTPALELATLPTEQPKAQKALSPKLQLIKAAQDNGGTLSLAQAALITGFEHEQLQTLLKECLQQGYAEIDNDRETGAIRYRFDV